jgi:hypothetical protein
MEERGAPSLQRLAVRKAGYPHEIGWIRTSIRNPTMVTSVVRLKAIGYHGETLDPTRFTCCTERTGLGGDVAYKYFYFFLVSSFREHSRLSLRPNTVTAYGSINNERLRLKLELWYVLDLLAGRTTLFRTAARGGGWRRGETNVGEARGQQNICGQGVTNPIGT